MQLLEVKDLRTINTDGTKELLREPAICHRCHKPHAKIYVVEDDNGKVWEVGSTCCKILFGWMPGKNEVLGASEGVRLGTWMKQKGLGIDKVWSLICKKYPVATYTNGERSKIYDYARRALTN